MEKIIRKVKSVKIIGLGGTGSPVAQAMAQFLSSRRMRCTLWLIDGDLYEERNRERVLFSAYDNKAVVKAQELTSALCGSLTILPIPQWVTSKNVHRIIEEKDIIFLCVDNHSTRKLVSNRCHTLNDVVLFSGGNDGITDGQDGTYGNVQVYVRHRGRNVTNPLTRFHPEIARPRDKRPDELGCAALAQSAPQLVFTNLAVASAMLGTFYAWLQSKLDYEEVYLDIVLGKMTPVRRAVKEKG